METPVRGHNDTGPVQVAGVSVHADPGAPVQAAGRDGAGAGAVHVPASSARQQVSLSSLPTLCTYRPCRPMSVLDSVDRIGKEMQVNIINRPYIGSVSNSVGSDIPSEQSGEHFFYI